MLFIVAHRLIKCPERVRKSLLMISPNALGTKNSPNMAPLATTRHLTSDEMASAISDSKMIQTIDPKKIAQTIHRFAHSHAKPARDAWKKKISKPGNPRHQRQQKPDDGHLAEHVFSARKRSAQIKRQGVVRQVARDERRCDEHRQDKSERALDLEKVRKNEASIGSSSRTFICSNARAFALWCR